MEPWVVRSIPNVESSINKEDSMDKEELQGSAICVTKLLSGHGCFCQCLYKMDKSPGALQAARDTDKSEHSMSAVTAGMTDGILQCLRSGVRGALLCRPCFVGRTPETGCHVSSSRLRTKKLISIGLKGSDQVIVFGEEPTFTRQPISLVIVDLVEFRYQLEGMEKVCKLCKHAFFLLTRHR